MTKKTNSSDQPTKNIKTSKQRMRIGISFVVIATALIIIFMPKKSTNDTSSPSAGAMFKRQGELTLTKPNGKPIITIDIEIADDDSKREIGMMGRTVMEEREGMLFIFEEEYMASFWMKNCILSLDMIFINKLGEIITIHKNTAPFSEQSYAAAGLTLFVLEVNAGFTDKYGIKEGDRISWKRN